MPQRDHAAIEVFITKAQAYRAAIQIDPYQASYRELPLQLDQAYSAVLLDAQDLSLRTSVASAMDLHLSALGEFARWNGCGVIKIWLHQQQHGGSNPWMAARDHIEDSLRELQRVAPLLVAAAASRRELLTNQTRSRNAQVAAYLVDHPDAVLRQVADATGISKSAIQRTAAWRKCIFQKKRPKTLTNQMHEIDPKRSDEMSETFPSGKS